MRIPITILMSKILTTILTTTAMKIRTIGMIHTQTTTSLMAATVQIVLTSTTKITNIHTHLMRVSSWILLRMRT